MTSEQRSEKMLLIIDLALATQTSKDHRFGLVGSGKDELSPKLSPHEQFYFNCVRCGRTIFEDGSGNATQNRCDA